MGTFIILSIALLNAGRSVDTAGTKSVEYMKDSKARNICNSMTSILLSRLADSTSLRIETPITESLMGGSVTYQMYSVNSVGESGNDNHEGEDNGDDHEGDDHEGDDHGDDDHGGDDHGDDHSSMFTSPLQRQNSAIFSASILGAFSFSSASFAFDDDHSDDHESDDHDDDEGDDHEGDDHDDHDGEDHGGDHDDDDEPADGDTIKIVVSATVSNSTQTQTTYVAIVPPVSATTVALQGGISSNCSIETKGNMVIDGRNHDLNGALIANTGIYGVWTTSSLNQSGSSKIGGTKSSTDYAPSKPANSNIVKTSGSLPSGSFPDSPDKFFGGSSAGFPEGTMKDFAISGANGSQYVTDPDNLTTPLTGITYVELPSGDTWQSMDISGTGVLVVHNAAGNAIIKNLNSGTFKGIIIADDIIHVHTSIYGAVIGLSSHPSDGNCLGNGNGSILYSKDAVNQAVASVNSCSTSKNYGFGKTRLNVIGWYDQQ
jgi:hypothetical protein